MNLNWLKDNTIFLTIHGSQAYGLNGPNSDLDIKGICIPPKSVANNLFQKFEQAIDPKFIDEDYSHLKNPNNPKLESSVYSLDKFIKLASMVNPNVIELLFVDSKSILFSNKTYDILRENNRMFLSKRARHTFSGYAMAQLKKIERHRKWLIMGELKKPNRVDFGLPDIDNKDTNEIFGLIKSQVEKWNLSSFNLQSDDANSLKERIWELSYFLSNGKNEVDWGNWPEKYADAVFKKMQEELDIPSKMMSVLNAERLYRNALDQYNSWENWKLNRNKERAGLEKKGGYDLKHGMHLMRLLNMGVEILKTGQVNVIRPDRDALISIKNGDVSYDDLIKMANERESELKEWYGKSSLPDSVDEVKINELYSQLIELHYNR